ncbi:MAG: histidinol-phosphatase HisJ family protein [Christensenellales bacterium]|jgi:histidinol-phosphatase (PHP family)
MRCDYHLHTNFSLDSETPILDQLKRAAELGLEEICFTDHSDHVLPNRTMYFSLDIPAYKKAVAELPDLGVRVRWGVEFGIPCEEDSTEEYMAPIRGAGFDFVIASAHLVEGLDPYYPDYYVGKTISQANAFYVETLVKYVRRLPADFFSAVGHVDYGSKFNPDKTAIMRYSDCPDALDTLFTHVIENGKCIEINTSLYRKLGKEIPGLDWLSRYRELGGEYVTFGSDAHIPEHVGYRLDDAVELAKAAGIKYYATYQNMQPTMHRL